jgi:hypothetical protein
MTGIFHAEQCFAAGGHDPLICQFTRTSIDSVERRPEFRFVPVPGNHGAILP